MANIKSALKRIRSSEKKRVNNKYYHKTMRNAIRDLRAVTDKKEGEKMYPDVVSKIDGLVKRNIIHKNKAGNLKSKLAKFVASLG